MPDSVLFVCLGNICRSPTAEGVFRARVERAGLAGRIEVASAGTGDWHVGEPPDRRAILHAAKRGYDLRSQRARQICVDDFATFNWILTMDRANLREVSALRPVGHEGHVGLFLDIIEENDGGDSAHLIQRVRAIIDAFGECRPAMEITHGAGI